MTSALDTSVVAPVSPSERPGLVSAVELVSEGGGLLSDSVVMSEGPSPSTEVLVRVGKESGCCQLVLMTSVVF